MVATSAMTKEVHVLCDHDALYAAIDLKLRSLAEVQVHRLVADPLTRQDSPCVLPEADLIIIASTLPIRDVRSLLSRASLLDHVGRVPLLVISEQPSRSESQDMITYLNFPFDMDDLAHAVGRILNRPRSVIPQEVG